jgi:ribosomal protein L24E
MLGSTGRKVFDATRYRWCLRCGQARPEQGGTTVHTSDGTTLWICSKHDSKKNIVPLDKPK